MTELFLYGREDGLFKQVLNQSKVIAGRYHVSPNYGHDLNTNNLETFIKDPKYGLQDVAIKYPLCVCMTPSSRFVKINTIKWEHFSFTLFFLCNANQDGNNQIKKLDKDTNTSAQTVPDDWDAMKQCASDFLDILWNVTLKKSLANGAPLKSILNIDFDNAVIGRLTLFNNDKLNGASVSFQATMQTNCCAVTDYNNDVLNNITIPNM